MKIKKYLNLKVIMNENEILGFDPMSLSVFNQEETKSSQSFNSNIYRPRPDESKSEDGHYYSTIKIIYNPYDLKHSILEQQSYGLKDHDGWFTVVSSLTINDTNCPIFKAWKKCHYAEEGSDLWKQAATVEKGGKGLFDKRFARYVTIQVIKDKNHPELEGKYMFWKLPKSIYDIINAKMNPSKESGKVAIPVMDFLFGRTLDLEVVPGPNDPANPERKARETKYLGELSEEVVSCVNPDGSPILTDDEQEVLDTYVRAMSKVWRTKDPSDRAELLAEVNAAENTKELRTIYARVLEEIKKHCPNLIEELSYKEWDEATKVRVQKWIDAVLACNNPSAEDTAKVNEDILNTVGTSVPTPAKTVEPAPVLPTNESDDDLPF